jgi:hypothetical protein
MTAPRNPWPLVSERRTHPQRDGNKNVAEQVRTLLTPENLAQLEKLLAGDPRLVAYAHALAKKAGPR